jgi:hypothetical protein
MAKSKHKTSNRKNYHNKKKVVIDDTFHVKVTKHEIMVYTVYK